MCDSQNYLSAQLFNLNRRHLLATLGGTIAGITLFSQRLKANNSLSIKPFSLYPGAGAGLITPASAIFLEEDLNLVIEQVKKLGLTAYLAPHIMDNYGYLGGKDSDRAADINQFFADPKIKILLPMRGGWGCSRLLPYLDYELIRNNPKIVVGFSDITALILGIYAKTGLITFHGPVGLTSWGDEQVQSFHKILFDGAQITFNNNSSLKTIYPGKIQGKLIGGNLSILSTLIGTDYFPNPEGAILFVEDIGEDIYKIDRLLAHLKLSGILNKLAGFIFGQCIRCQPCPPDNDPSLTLEQVILDHIQPLKIPSWHGATIGHVKPILTFPIGINVEIDATLGTIKMLEAGVKTKL
jgi:muramoyltetrapeptide carboxypeptidase